MEKLVLDKRVKNIVFIVEGGLGKNIASTAVVRAIKKTFPDKRITVIAGFHDIFLQNPNVYRTYNFANPLHFYEDYINEETHVIRCEPYLDYKYLQKECHIVESWCRMIGIESDGINGDIHYLPKELISAELILNKYTQNQKKKLVLFQWVGGKIPKNKEPEELESSLMVMYKRAIPKEVAQEVTNVLKDKGYIVGIIGHENFPKIENSHLIAYPPRTTTALLKFAHSFISIDSFLQHASVTNEIQRKGVVVWGGTHPTCLGYKDNVNLTKEICSTPFCHRPNSFLFDTQAHGASWDCPHGEPCTKYTSEEIIKAFEENFETKKTKKKKK